MRNSPRTRATAVQLRILSIIGTEALREHVNPKRIQWRAHGRRHTVGTGRKGSRRKYDRLECQSSSHHFVSQLVLQPVRHLRMLHVYGYAYNFVVWTVA